MFALCYLRASHCTLAISFPLWPVTLHTKGQKTSVDYKDAGKCSSAFLFLPHPILWMRKPSSQSPWVTCPDVMVSRHWTEPWPSCGFPSRWFLQCSAIPCCAEQRLTVAWDSVQTSCWEDYGYRWVSVEICRVGPSSGPPGLQQTQGRKKQWIHFPGLLARSLN